MKILLLLLTICSTCFGNPDLPPIFTQVAAEFSVPYELLSKMADIESSFDPNAKAPTSSARGLFQVISSTEKWLREICDISGDIFDPLTNTRMGACYLQWNTQYFESKMGRTPSFVELYLLHFLGSASGIKFVKLTNSKGSESACKHFPKECNANPNIFWKSAENPRNLAEVMELMRVKVEDARVLKLEEK